MIGIYDCVGFITTLAGFLPIFAKEGILYFIKITASFEINNKTDEWKKIQFKENEKE